MNYKSNEEALNAIFAYSSNGYIVIDATSKIVFISKRIETLTDWNINELVGKEAKVIYSLPEGGQVKSNEGLETQVSILFCKNGKKITLPAKQLEVKGLGFLIIFHIDKGVSSDFSKAKDEFVSTVSHELRTPLTSIKGFADTLLRAGDKIPQENQKKYLIIIKDQADRLTRLVEDLLAVSRLESQNLQLTIRSLDINKTIDKVCESLSGKSANHNIVREIEKDTPNVWADADRLEQILTNLIDNALKYSPSKSTVTIKVSSLVNEHNTKDKLKIEVTDQGVGIGNKDITKIFTKFGRLDNPLTRQTQGTGLGLFITKSLVLALKGEIYVTSKSGETTFTVILPAVITNPAIPLSAPEEVKTLNEREI